MKYRTLHYLNIIYCHTHSDVRTLLCVFNVTSLWSEFVYIKTCSFQCFVIDKAYPL